MSCAVPDPPLVVCALYDFVSTHPSGLTFQAGALIHVLARLDSGWWDGLLDPHLLGATVRGWFPSNYVQPISAAECASDAHIAAEVAAVLAASSDPLLIHQALVTPSPRPSQSSSSDLSDFFSQDAALSHPTEALDGQARQAGSPIVRPDATSASPINRHTTSCPSPELTSFLPSLRDEPATVVDRLPPRSALVQHPWVLRIADDERTFFYYNLVTQETRDNLDLSPSDEGEGPSEDALEPYDSLCDILSLPGKSASAYLDDQPQQDTRSLGRTETAGQDCRSTASSKVDSALHQQRAMARGSSELVEDPKDDDPGAHESTEAGDLTARYDELASVQEQAADCLSQFVDILSGIDSPIPIIHTAPLSLSPIDLFTNAQRDVISSIRDLLYASGGTWMFLDGQTPHGLAPASSSTSPYSSPTSVFTEVPGRSRSDTTASIDLSSLCSSLFPSSGSKATTPNVPPAVATMCRRVANSLARWILSCQALAEHHRTKFFPTASVTQDGELGTDAEPARLVVLGERVQEDTVHLLRKANELSAEIDRLRTLATSRVLSGQELCSEEYPVDHNWPFRLHGVLLSGEGPAGIDPHTLSGGAAAGWRGNGFATPSSKRSARHETSPNTRSNHFLGEPTQLLTTTAPIIQAVTSASHEVKSCLMDLDRKVTRLVGSGFVSPSATAEGPSTSASDIFARPASRSQTDEITASAMQGALRSALARAGEFVKLLEEIDLASSLGWDSKEGASGVVGRKASTLTATFIQLKQDLYDGMAHIFADAQEAANKTSLQGDWPLGADAAARLAHGCSSLVSVVERTTETLHELALMADEHARLSAPQRDTRGQQSHPPSAPLQRRASSSATPPVAERKVGPIIMPNSQPSTDGMMYLGPGVFVPDGPAVEPNSTPQSAPSDSTTAAGRLPHRVSLSAATWGMRRKMKTRPPSAARPALRDGSAPTVTPNLHRHSFLPVRNNTISTAGDTSSASVPPKRVSSATSSLAPSRSPSIRPADLAPSDHPPQNEFPAEHTRSVDSVVTPRTSSGDTRLCPSASFSSVSVPQMRPPSEERERNVVGSAPVSLPSGISPQDVDITPDGQIKGATLEALIVYLTTPEHRDTLFDSTFLLTFRSFTSVDVLLDHLCQRFCLAAPAGLCHSKTQAWESKVQRPVQLQVFRILKMWLETYLHEWSDAPHLPRLRAFVKGEMATRPSMKLASQQLLRLLDQREEQGTAGPVDVSHAKLASAAKATDLPPPPPIYPRQASPSETDLLSLDPLEVARQLTLMESELFSRIQPFECLNKEWSRPSGMERAKGIKQVIHLSNLLSGWSSETVLLERDVRKRALLVSHFIAIASQCRNLGNFSTMMAVVSGLNSSPVHRLRKTWTHVPSHVIQQLHGLNNIMQSTKNFALYRETMHQLSPPCIPFLGVYLTDLTFIEDGNPDRLRHDPRLINFAKQHKTAEVVREIMICQSIPYNFARVPSIRQYLDQVLSSSATDEELYERSLALEPREGEDERLATLLQNSGFL